MSHRTLQVVLVLAAIAAIAAPSLAQQQGGGGSANAGGSPRQSASAPRASATGQRVKLGSKIATSGSKLAVPQKLRLGSTLQQGGSGLSNSGSNVTTQAPPNGLGSKIAGSQVGSKIAGSQVGSRLGLGSAIAGSHVAAQVPTGSQVVATPGSGRFRSVVPGLTGQVPRVSSNNPGLVMFLFDASGSMAQPIAGTPGVTKADAAAEAANNTIMEFVLAHRGGDGSVRNRLQIAQVEYGAHVRAGLGADIVPLADLANNPTDFINSTDPSGQTSQIPIWLRPQASGSTPMHAAFTKAHGVVGGYLRSRPAGGDSRPRLLLGFNVTDGDWTDSDPSGELAAISQEAAAAGDAFIMTNIHVTTNPNAVPVLFPTEEQAANFDDYGKRLFEMSSPVPDALMALVSELNPDAATGTGPRMMAVNANIDGLNSVIQVGSSLAANAAPAAPTGSALRGSATAPTGSALRGSATTPAGSALRGSAVRGSGLGSATAGSLTTPQNP